MFLTRWQPLVGNEFNRLQHEMGQFFDQFGRTGWPTPAPAFPALNVWEDEHNVYAEAELPGIGQDALQITVSQGDQLTLAGERRPMESQGVWHRQERGHGRFSRTVQLPALVNPDQVEARLEHGVLLVTLAKSEAAKPRRITVKSE
ncbi:MAG: Hsp20/alpha crystallin family protein [Planctomycetia bacterium]|nr:Hsp20/alpha crystallin family protein [Planctomycetia bacterium]